MALNKNLLKQLGGDAFPNPITMKETLEDIFPISEDNKATSAVALAAQNNLKLDTDAFDLDDLLNGLDLKHPTIKLPKAGTLFFTVEDEPIKDLKCTIVYHHKINVLYVKPYSDMDLSDSSAPDCSSVDGITGVENDGRARVECESCPMNAYVDGRKRCSNKIRLYVVPEGSSLPHIIDLPPTSFGAYVNFMNVFASKKKNPYEYLTSITLTEAKNPKGNSYNKAVFGRLEAHSDASEYKELREAVKTHHALQIAQG